MRKYIIEIKSYLLLSVRKAYIGRENGEMDKLRIKLIFRINSNCQLGMLPIEKFKRFRQIIAEKFWRFRRNIIIKAPAIPANLYI